MLSEVLEHKSLPPNAQTVVKQSLDGAPEPALPEAVKTVLAALAPEHIVRYLDELLQAGMPWMTDVGRRRVQLLSFEHPKAGSIRLPDEDVLDGSVDWRIYLAALGHPTPVSTAEILQVVPDVPLSVVDDFIELGLLGSDDRPWRLRDDKSERTYLKARLAPKKIGRADAVALGWDEMERRHRFLEGEDLDDGDDLFSLLASFWRGEPDISLRTRLPVEARVIYDQIIVGAQVGRWPEHITTDRGLWALLAALWVPGGIVNPENSEFHVWRALYNSYRWILMGWLDKARVQVQHLLKAADKSASGEGIKISADLCAEAYNMGAYLALENEELELAVKLLRRIRKQSPALTENLKYLRRRRATLINDRDHWENPYLMLGVPHGDPDWEDQWRALRKQLNGDIDRLTRINSAKRRLSHAKRNGGQFYVLPLDERVLLTPRKRSAVLLPEAEPLQRRTPQSGPEELAGLRAGAIRALLDEFTSHPSIAEESN